MKATLAGLLLLLASTPARAEWYATLAEMSGLIRIRPAGAGDYRAGARDQRLAPGDSILTLAESRARLEFSDGSRVWLAAHTQLTVAVPRGRRRRLDLARGFMRMLAAKVAPGDELGVITPTAIAAVKGTEFTLGVSDAVTDIAVLEGEVLCADRAQRYAVLMRAGEAARWDRNGLWQPVRRLGAEETSALRGDEGPTASAEGTAPAAGTGGAPAASAPAGLRLGGYVTAGWHLVGGDRTLSQPWLGLSPFSPMQVTRGEVRNSFDAPWLSLTADSPLGDRAHTFWELMATGGGRNQFPGVDDLHGRLEILQGWGEADLVPVADGPPLLTLRAGIIPVPVGVLGGDAALPRRTFTSFPLSAIRIVPVPWQDAGAQASGGIALGPVTARYQAALVNGLQIEPNDWWESFRLIEDGLWWARPSEDERSLGRDNNRNKAVAGRLGFGWGTGSGVGVSGYQGKADASNSLGVTIAAADLTLSFDLPAAVIRLRAEGSRASLTRPGGFVLAGQWPEAGGYAELEVAPRRFPLGFGAGASQVRRGHPVQGMTEVYAAVSWKFVPQMAFKLEGQRYRARRFAANVLAAQVAAFW